MHTVYSKRKSALASLYFLTLFLLAFTISACGAASSTSTGGSSSSPVSSGSSSTSVRGYGVAEGCPSNVVVSTAPAQANETLKLTDTNTTISAHNGDVIEIRLPFGHKWDGPTPPQGLLVPQGPAGYAWKNDSVCIWHFVAKGTGKTQLTFSGQALCKAGQMCPMYIMAASFTIDVK